jgi:hypothetical protein
VLDRRVLLGIGRHGIRDDLQRLSRLGLAKDLLQDVRVQVEV